MCIAISALQNSTGNLIQKIISGRSFSISTRNRTNKTGHYGLLNTPFHRIGLLQPLMNTTMETITPVSGFTITLQQRDIQTIQTEFKLGMAASAQVYSV